MSNTTEISTFVTSRFVLNVQIHQTKYKLSCVYKSKMCEHCFSCILWQLKNSISNFGITITCTVTELKQCELLKTKKKQLKPWPCPRRLDDFVLFIHLFVPPDKKRFDRFVHLFMLNQSMIWRKQYFFVVDINCV